MLEIKQEFKTCNKCGVEKHLDEFYMRGKNEDKPLPHCKACHNVKYITYSDFDLFEPFDIPERPEWLVEIAKKYEVELNPQGNLFQTGLFMDCTETPAYTLSIAGSQTGKSRSLLIESIIMATGVIPVSMRHDKGIDTGVPRAITPENIKRFGQLPDGSCGNVTGVGIYPAEKIPPKGSASQVWIASYAEVKNKMWRTRLQQLIPSGTLAHKGDDGWSERYQTYYFKSGNMIRLITYEQKYKKTEGEMAWMIVLDEEPPIRDYFISAVEHCQYLRLCFSPINGLGWAYFDCYLPAIKVKDSPIKIFNCTQYDSPFQTKSRVDAKLKTYKPYEIKSRIFGQFSEVIGKPYYTHEITQQFIKNYIPRHTLARILPMSKPEAVRDTIDIKMRIESADAYGDDTWEIYEKLNEHDAYWLSADTAEGNENPDVAANKSVAYVRRLPRVDEKDPVMVAAIQSSMRNVEFAWTCLYAAIYYNCALIAPETGVSADGAVFITTIAGYPYIYRHTSTNDQTRRLQEKFGFDTKNATRKYAFDLMGTWCYDHIESSHIYHYALLKELSECITGKGGRPDHPERGSTDCLMAFGISEYVYSLAKNQIKCNKKIEEAPISNNQRFPNIWGFNKPIRETRRVIGSSRGMDARFGVGKMAVRM